MKSREEKEAMVNKEAYHVYYRDFQGTRGN
jgi:hypothetical protein